MPDPVTGRVKPLPQGVARLRGLALGKIRISEELPETRITRQESFAFEDVGHVGVGILASVVGMGKSVIADDVAVARPATQHLLALGRADVLAGDEPGSLHAVANERRPDFA